MQQLLFLDQYDLNFPTWVYLSTLLIIGVYFKFSRLWSVRNLDLAVLICICPGLLFLEFGYTRTAFLWLLGTQAVVLIRLLIDPLFVRRPLLEPNLSTGGLVFMIVSLFVFIIGNVLSDRPMGGGVAAGSNGFAPRPPELADPPRIGLAAGAPLHLVQATDWDFPLKRLVQAMDASADPATKTAGLSPMAQRFLAGITLTGHLAVMLGLLFMGYLHFGSFRTGAAIGALYLVVPYTAQITKVAHLSADHVLGSALVIWGMVAYRRPFLAGGALGLAAALVIAPCFLIPLWASFYWQRGLVRCLLGIFAGLVTAGALITLGVGNLTWVPSSFQSLIGPALGHATLWSTTETAWRIPVITAFGALCIGVAIWPPRKNLGTVLSFSGAIMVAMQFWMTHGGGGLLGWFLPLFLLTAFRPNLDDRVALAVLGDGWFSRRKMPTNSVRIAA